ncbi:MAG TPA: nucleotidyltransferase domain-containing protein [Puia sp.]|jgi:hypothetical protein|nr:nucleotidyltransferase domain-containing protein [Puia sp.]
MLETYYFEQGNSILKVLAYFSLFSYPVTKEELQLFFDREINIVELTQSLAKLKSSKLIFQHGNFYSISDNPDLYDRRIKGNAHAATLLRTAYRISKFLFRFPFVRAVCISGSLSKNFADENADIDFFIITKRGRLWIARTMMHLYKKMTFIAGRQHCYCMNYYIDEEALIIEEKNEFTATEMITLLPACGSLKMIDFFNSNDWVTKFYPSYAHKNFNSITAAKDSRIKNKLEKLFNNKSADWIDDYLMRVTKRRWKLKEDKMKLNQNGQRLGLSTAKHFCKPNPEFLQKKILKSYLNKLEELRKKWDEIQQKEKSIFLN